MQGKIIKGIAGFYYVYVVESGIYECKAKGIFRKEKMKPLVGDDVEIEILDEKDREGNLIKILPRINQLIRPAAANVGQALILFALKSPNPNFMLIDRFMISMDRLGIDSALCFNKADVAGPGEIEEIQDIYKDCGHPLIFMSVKSGEGLDSVRAFLEGKTTVFAGPSGVGKSSLTNELQKDVHMETGEISKKLARGKNTTRHAELIMVKPGTYIFDTPGFTYLDLFDLTKEELADYYSEFAPFTCDCRFNGCAHMDEPDCGVKAAVLAGKINAVRYENYRQIYEELKDIEKRKYS